MALTGTRKAATLLMSLDPTTAAELIRSADSTVITELASEVACIQASGKAKSVQSLAPALEFFTLLRGKSSSGDHFLKDVLDEAIGSDQAAEVMTKAQQSVQARDPFRQIRSTKTDKIASALSGESPQVIAIVLSELPAKKSSELLTLLDDEIRPDAIRCMASGDQIPQEVKIQVAATIERQLTQLTDKAVVVGKDKDLQLRKVAVLLRSLPAENREPLLKCVTDENEENGQLVQDLMVIWEDLKEVAPKSLQEALRNIEAGTLALSLYEAQEAIVELIKSNMSERAAAMLTEEADLLSEPPKADVEKAREQFLDVLRQMNSKGELTFKEE